MQLHDNMPIGPRSGRSSDKHTVPRAIVGRSTKDNEERDQ